MTNQDKNEEYQDFEEELEESLDQALEKEDDSAADEASDDVITISKSKVVLMKKLLQNIKDNNDQLIKLLGGFVSPEEESRIAISQAMDEVKAEADDSAENVIEGVFDGEHMIGPDGKQYNISANYASKSKLVEGDILKLSITKNGTFIYKQIGPIERSRVVGTLKRGVDGEYTVLANGKSWRILTASVTYFKGEDGDETVILVPKNGESHWAAVENIIKKQ